MKMTKKRGWHNPSKSLKKTIEGKCPICHLFVKNLESHKRAKHLESIKK
jgi:predicted DCC family thiol-disulfide oxidoreductase YuxK